MSSGKSFKTDWIWTVGAVTLALMTLVVVSGLFLMVHYVPTFEQAFSSVQKIRSAGGLKTFWHHVHLGGASLFFLATYFHMGRALYFGAYKKPKQAAWIGGVFLLGVLLLTAMTGYALPQGQMGYWALVVVTNLAKEIPVIGPWFVSWVSEGALSRLFLIHFMAPFAGLVLTLAHVAFLRTKKVPTNVRAEEARDKELLMPKAPPRNFIYVVLFLVFGAVVLAVKPDLFASSGNDVIADRMSTPDLIRPEWYLLPFFAMLRSVSGDLVCPFTSVVLLTANQLGALVVFGAYGVLFLLPWLDRSSVRWATFRPAFKKLFWLLVTLFLTLGYVGSRRPEGLNLALGQVATTLYFLCFLVILPLVSRFERAKERKRFQ